jgi:glycosyltransferase involved in cell wall biosynthesis
MRKRIRVMSVLNRLCFGGHESRLLSLAKNIDRDRFDYSLVTLTGDPEDASHQGEMRAQFADAGVTVEDFGESQQRFVPGPARLSRVCQSSFGMAKSISKLARRIRQQDIDVVEAHHTAAMFAAVMAARLAGVPSVITAYHTRSWESVWMRWPGRMTFRWADAVVTDSLARRDDIARWATQPTTKVAVIPNGIEPPQPTRSAVEVRRSLGLPLDPAVKIIGQVSGIVPSKGHEVLLQAAERLLKHEANVAFAFVGYSRGHEDYLARLRQRIEELGLKDRIAVVGYPGPIGDVWNVIDIHVHASQFDSLPNAILEGMSLGKPAVVTSVGGIPEVVTHEETGLVVPPGDADALEVALTKLLRSPTFANRLGEAAARRHRERLRPEQMASSMERLFLRLAG